VNLCCPACNQPMGLANLRPLVRAAECDGCREVFSFSDEGSGQLRARSQCPAQPQAITVERPATRATSANGYRSLPQLEAQRRGALLLKWRWRPIASHEMLLASIALDAVAIWALWALGEPKWLGWLGFTPILAVGIAATYLSVALFFNKTRLCLQASQLSITHGPLPWPGNRSILTSDIRKLRVRQKAGMRRGSERFEVLVEGATESRSLFAFLGSLEEAEFVVWVLNEQLAP